AIASRCSQGQAVLLYHVYFGLNHGVVALAVAVGQRQLVPAAGDGVVPGAAFLEFEGGAHNLAEGRVVLIHEAFAGAVGSSTETQVFDFATLHSHVAERNGHAGHLDGAGN
nr:hypothetical protein [Tanacetum cinerariifolium]